MPFPPYTPCPGGFVTARTLPDGSHLIEGWALNLNPHDSDQPRHDAAYHWTTGSEQEAADVIAEFAGYLATPLAA